MSPTLDGTAAAPPPRHTHTREASAAERGPTLTASESIAAGARMRAARGARRAQLDASDEDMNGGLEVNWDAAARGTGTGTGVHRSSSK